MQFLSPTVLEWIGYVGSVVVAVSLTMSSIKKLRWYNLLGASIFSFYGFMIGALPVGFLNLFIVLADIYYLYKMYSYKASFDSLEVASNEAYTNFFIKSYHREIKEFFPKFEENYAAQLHTGNETVTFMLLRDAVVAGVFMGVRNSNRLNVLLDFVTVPYRDFKPGDYIYKTNIDQIKSLGIDTIECVTENKAHQKYLSKMGFVSNSNGTVYEKKI